MTVSEPQPTTVLVTGATGFIARHVVVQLLDAGWEVRGTARSGGGGTLADRLAGLRADMTTHLADPAALDRFTLVSADLTADEGWAEAVDGCGHVCHVASPVPGDKEARRVDMIAPALDGTLRVLRAAAGAGVRRVVLTSSIAAVLYGVERRGRVFTEDDWSDIDSRRLGAYERSKTLAERAAWDFVASTDSGTIELATINPGLVLGPLIGKETSTSNEAVRRLLARELPACPDITFVFADVRDVAAAHVAALTTSEAAGRRYLCGISGHSLLDVAMILAREYGPQGYRVPTRRLPGWVLRLYALFDPAAAIAVNDLADPQHIDNSRVVDLLGRPLRDLREMTVAMAASLEEHGLVHPRAGATGHGGGKRYRMPTGDSDHQPGAAGRHGEHHGEDHHEDHHEDHGRGHAHGHRHGHEEGFDWEAMADSIELDGAMVLPLVADVLADLGELLHWSQVGHVLDVGSGPGVVTAALAKHAEYAQVTALDSSPQLLARAERRLRADRRLARRVRTITADLDDELPEVAPADVIWASMVLHHVADPLATLRRLYHRLVPGGVLVLIEFAGPPAVLPPDDLTLLAGSWARLEAAAAAMIRERLGVDPWTLDWPGMLAEAGFVDTKERNRAAYHAAPLAEQARRWIVKHINRGLQMAGDRIPAADVGPLQDLADTALARRDLFVRAERRVLLARRALH